jgi:SAM-dependent MidA family methyltransferase
MGVIIQYLSMQTFADHMEQVLYGPSGYYSSGVAKSGKSGDYFTAPDVGPVFGMLIAEIFKNWGGRLKQNPLTVVEVGAGEGRLAKDILSTHPFSYHAIERSTSRREVLKNIPGIKVFSDLMAIQPTEGILFGNELIDAFPVHRVRVKNGKLEEAFVEDKKLRWAPPSTPRLQAYFDRLGITLPDEYETEVNLAMADWVGEAARVLKKGLLLFIDYGRPAEDYYAPERTKGTLRAFSKHKVGSDFMNSDGVDLTADVDFTSLALDARAAGFTPLAFMEMGTFLMIGVEKMVEAGHSPAPAGLRYLLHPEGMGAAFHVLILGKNINPKEWTFEHNRLRRLGLPA